ncbi:MAG: xanthine dehydrogenase family protein subunit M [Anaerolineaceae bacterium]|nr:xanthine dehydrogenase family protein subunit M [Anaerolineaceae bacterium]
MHRFEYCAPTNLPEAISLLEQYGSTARLIAGGTDLLTALKERTDRPDYLINLAGLADLCFIEYDPADGLRIGAAATVRQVEKSAVVRLHYPVISSAAATLASVQIRNLATVAGNICRASPSADLPPALLALGASVRLAGPSGQRDVPLVNFFTGPGKTVLRPDEILTEIRLPPVPCGSGAVYLKHCPRRAMDLAAIGIAAAVTLQAGRCSAVGIAMGAVAPTPRRAPKAEAILLGQQLSPDLIEQAAEAAAAEASPISDLRASAAYRRQMVSVLVRRALTQALELAQVTTL